MKFKKNEISIIFIFLFFSVINLSIEDNVNNFFYIIIIFSQTGLNKKGFLRKLWNDNIDVDTTGRERDQDESDSIKHCEKSDYIYYSIYAYGQNYTFPYSEYIDHYDAVSKIKII